MPVMIVSGKKEVRSEERNTEYLEATVYMQTAREMIIEGDGRSL